MAEYIGGVGLLMDQFIFGEAMNFEPFIETD